MRILIVTNHFFPEVFRVNDVAFDLAKRGHEIVVITCIPNYPEGHYLPGYGLWKKRKEYVKGVKIIRVPVIPRGSGNAGRLFFNYLSYLITASWNALFLSFVSKFDCIFVHETSPVTVGIPAVIVKWRQKIPLYFWVLDLWPESLSAAGGITNKCLLSVFTEIVNFLYKHSDKILISSRKFRQSILQKGNYHEKIVYFPNWGEDVFTKPFISNTLQLPEGFIVMYAGNIGEAQDFEAIMEAVLKLKDHPSIKWFFVGDGRKKKFVENFILHHQLGNTVFLPGSFPIEQMPSLLKQADVLLVSLKDELIFNLTVPAKLQAYMASSKAVCAMLNGEGAEIIREAKNGRTVPAGDSLCLAQQILELSQLSPKELNELGKNGFEYYKKHFKKEMCINNLCCIMNLS